VIALCLDFTWMLSLASSAWSHRMTKRLMAYTAACQHEGTVRLHAPLVALKDRECSTKHHASDATSCEGMLKRASNPSPKQKRHDASSE
jgi:hypothetical protein